MRSIIVALGYIIEDTTGRRRLGGIHTRARVTRTKVFGGRKRIEDVIRQSLPSVVCRVLAAGLLIDDRHESGEGRGRKGSAPSCIVECIGPNSSVRQLAIGCFGMKRIRKTKKEGIMHGRGGERKVRDAARRNAVLCGQAVCSEGLQPGYVQGLP